MSFKHSTSPSPSFQKHQKQVFWQILLPVATAAVVFLTSGLLMVLTPSLSTSRTGHWAAISLVWLISPLVIFALLLLILNIGLIYLMKKFLRVLPPYLRVGQVYSQVMVLKVTAFCDRLARPFIRWAGWVAGFQTLWTRFVRH